MHEFLQRLSRGDDLSADEAEQLIGEMMNGQVSEELMAEVLLAINEKGVSVEELVGAATAMRKEMVTISHSQSRLVDTCGTGGAGSGTFNVSTTAAIIVAAAGVPVAKHGNRKVSSKSGSADVLTELGVNIMAPLETVIRCLDEVGLCFCFAQLLHPAMKHVAPVRKKLGVPTIFNLLGPLCNPAGASVQVLGVGRPYLRSLLSETLLALGTEKAIVVHGRDTLCEVSNAADTDVSIVTESIDQTVWKPSDFGFSPTSRAEILASDPNASAVMVRGILAGEAGPPRETAVMNAAAALWASGASESLDSAARLAEETIDSGKASRLLARLGEVSHQC